MPTSIEALLIVALVLAPGYIFTQIARRVIAHIQEPTDLRFLLTIITAGTAIHALVFPWTIRIYEYYLANQLPSNQFEVFSWAVVVVFILPIALGILAGQMTLWSWVESLLDKIGLGYIDRMPSAWDYAVRKRRPRYVRIHLKDGQGVLGGVFADQSFAALEPGRADIYLEEAWKLDEEHNFDQAILDSRGIWVAHDVIAYVHFLERWDKSDEAINL